MRHNEGSRGFLICQLVTSAGCPESNQGVFNTEKRGNPWDLRETEPDHPVSSRLWLSCDPSTLNKTSLHCSSETNSRVLKEIQWAQIGIISKLHLRLRHCCLNSTHSRNGSSFTVAGDYVKVHMLRAQRHTSNHYEMRPLDWLLQSLFLRYTLKGSEPCAGKIITVSVFALQELNWAATTKVVKEC